jgi:hypothetical protein
MQSTEFSLFQRYAGSGKCGDAHGPYNWDNARAHVRLRSPLTPFGEPFYTNQFSPQTMHFTWAGTPAATDNSQGEPPR